MIRLIKSRIFIGLTLIGVVMLISAAPAFAEFEGKASTGKGELFQTTLEAGGGTVECTAFEESASKATWTIKNGKTAAEKGPDLFIKIEKLGKCKAKSAGLKEIEVTVGECEVELVQSGEGQEVPANIVKACTIKALLCEITVGAKTELKKVYIADSNEDKDLAVEPEVSGVSTIAKGCLEVKSSTEGKLKGVSEMFLVLIKLPDFELIPSQEIYTPTTRAGMIKIKNRLAMAGIKPTLIPIAGNRTLWPSPLAAEVTACETMAYTAVNTAGSECTLNVTNTGAGTLTIGVVHGLRAASQALRAT